MREPTNPGWAEEQTPHAFFVCKENELLKTKIADFGVFVGRKSF